MRRRSTTVSLTLLESLLHHGVNRESVQSSAHGPAVVLHGVRGDERPAPERSTGDGVGDHVIRVPVRPRSREARQPKSGPHLHPGVDPDVRLVIHFRHFDLVELQLAEPHAGDPCAAPSACGQGSSRNPPRSSAPGDTECPSDCGCAHPLDRKQARLLHFRSRTPQPRKSRSRSCGERLPAPIASPSLAPPSFGRREAESDHGLGPIRAGGLGAARRSGSGGHWRPFDPAGGRSELSS